MMIGLTPEEVQTLALSAKVSICATLLSCPIAIALAWVLARKNFPGKSILDAVLHLPLVLPPPVPGYLLLLCFGQQGWLGRWLRQYLDFSFAFNWKGAALASAVMAFPLLLGPIRLSFKLISRQLENAARSLGAGPWDVFVSVTLPLSLPGIMSGLILAFSRSLGEFGATITFVGNIVGETRTLPLAIYTAKNLPDGDDIAARLIAISLALGFFALLANEWLTKRIERRLGLG
jgi:molybdate transport system permease protein